MVRANETTALPPLLCYATTCRYGDSPNARAARWSPAAVCYIIVLYAVRWLVCVVLSFIYDWNATQSGLASTVELAPLHKWVVDNGICMK